MSETHYTRMTPYTHSAVGARFGIVWIVSHTITYVVASVVNHFPFSFPPGSGVNTSFEVPAAIVGAIHGAVSGMLIGLFPGLLLRKYHIPVRYWMLSSIVAFGLLHMLGDGVPSSIGYIPITVFGSLLLSVLQWFVLHRHFKQPGTMMWIPVSSGSFYTGIILGLLIFESSGLMQLSGPEGWVLQHVFVGAVAGFIWSTGTSVLLALLTRPSRLTT